VNCQPTRSTEFAMAKDKKSKSDKKSDKKGK